MGNPDAKEVSDSPPCKDQKKMKQMRLPFAPIKKDSAINIQRESQAKEAKEKIQQEEDKAKGVANEETEGLNEKSKDKLKDKEQVCLQKKTPIKLQRTDGKVDAETRTAPSSQDEKVCDVDQDDKKKISKKRKKPANSESPKGSRRKSLREEGQERSSEGKLKVKEANIAEAEIKTLKVKMDFKSQKTGPGKSPRPKEKSGLLGTPVVSRTLSSETAGVCSPAALDDRKRGVNVEIAKLKVKVNELKDKLESAVQKQEFLVAAELKSTISEAGEEIARLESVLERADPAELKKVLSEHQNRTPSTPLNNRKRPVLTVTTPGTPRSDGSPCLKVKKFTPKQKQQQKDKEERAKQREAEKQAKEEEKQLKAEQKLKEKLEREKEKKDKEIIKEKEKKEKEAQREKDKLEREAKKEQERLEKEKAKKEKELEKLRKEEEKEREKREKQEEKEKQEKIEKQKKEKLAQSFKSFFVKSASGSATESKEPTHEILNQFRVKDNMRLAPVSRIQLNQDSKESLLSNLDKDVKIEGLYLNLLKARSVQPKSTDKTWKLEPLPQEDDDDIHIVEEDEELLQAETGIEIDVDDEGKKKLTAGTRAKLLQFCENERPAYWGTWSKQSSRVGPRRPFAKDCEFFDYDYDSDDDWEEEEQGESLSDEELDKEEDDKDEDIEDDNEDGFFVGHGVLDKDEARHDDSDSDDDFDQDEEMKRMKMKAAQFEEDYKNRKKKMPTKLKPRVFGCFWVKGDSDDDSKDAKDIIVYEQLLNILNPYRAIVHGSVPIGTSFTVKKSSPSLEPQSLDQEMKDQDVAAKSATPKSRVKLLKEFPAEGVVDLIRLVHNSPRNRKFLVQEFYMFWSKKAIDDAAQKCELSKRLISEKIREIAKFVNTKWTVRELVLNESCVDVSSIKPWVFDFDNPLKPKTPTSTEGVESGKNSIEASPSATASPSSSLITKFAKVMSYEERQKQFEKISSSTKPATTKPDQESPKREVNVLAKHLIKKRIQPVTVDLTDTDWDSYIFVCSALLCNTKLHLSNQH